MTTTRTDEPANADQEQKSSRFPGFYALTLEARQQAMTVFADLSEDQEQAMTSFNALSEELASTFIENAVGTMGLPLGIATNFKINGKDIIIPMAVEESSVLAAASHGAKFARMGGGFTTNSTLPIGTGQIQVFPKEKQDFDAIFTKEKQGLIDFANAGQERLLARGGGAIDINWKYIEATNSLVFYLDVNTCDAMGANLINTMCEKLSVRIAQIIECSIGLRILTNLTDKRLARAHCLVPKEALTNREFDGADVVDRIVSAYEFAAHDVYRATTHNKGVMNGIDPVVIATGNDWRAVEAGSHAYCCRNGRYEPMTKWWKNANGDLEGSIELPIAVGTVGGVTKLHPSAQAALKVLGNPSGRELSEIIVAVGLAQNLSALRALGSEGIQRGHMSLHESNMALSRSGASRD